VGPAHSLQPVIAGKYLRVSVCLLQLIEFTFPSSHRTPFPLSRDPMKSFEATNDASCVAFQPFFTLTFVAVGF